MHLILSFLHEVEKLSVQRVSKIFYEFYVPNSLNKCEPQNVWFKAYKMMPEIKTPICYEQEFYSETEEEESTRISNDETEDIL